MTEVLNRVLYGSYNIALATDPLLGHGRGLGPLHNPGPMMSACAHHRLEPSKVRILKEYATDSLSPGFLYITI